jgi:hypothetical protein
VWAPRKVAAKPLNGLTISWPSACCYVVAMRTMFLRFLVAAIALAPTLVMAHARLAFPVRRVMADNNGGIKEAAKPCGGAKPATAPNVFTVGQTIMVDIQETIDHPGHYELFWSNNNDATFTLIPGMNNIANPATLQASTKVAVTLPNTACENCTLQLIMVMSDSMTNYYSCADVKLAAAAADLAGTAPDLTSSEDLVATMFQDDFAVSGGEDASVPGAEADMTKKPGADSAGIACAMGGSNTGAAALGSLIILLFAICLVPALRSR